MTVSHFSFFRRIVQRFLDSDFHSKVSRPEWYNLFFDDSFFSMIVQLSWCLPTLPRLRGKDLPPYLYRGNRRIGWILINPLPSSLLRFITCISCRVITMKRTMINTFEISEKCFIKILNYWKSHVFQTFLFSEDLKVSSRVIKLFPDT